jgi:hypothetical protein
LPTPLPPGTSPTDPHPRTGGPRRSGYLARPRSAAEDGANRPTTDARRQRPGGRHGPPNETARNPGDTDRTEHQGREAAGNARRTHGCRFRFTEPSLLVRSGDELDQHSSPKLTHDRAEGVSTPPCSIAPTRCKAPLLAAIRVAARGSGLPRLRSREGSVKRNLHLCVLPALPAASLPGAPCPAPLPGFRPALVGPFALSGPGRCGARSWAWPPGLLAP